MVHALSVSLNKLGDLRHYSDDLVEARSLYSQALAVRRKAAEEAERGSTPAQVRAIQKGQGLGAGGWRLEAGGWRLGAGGWRLGGGGWGVQAGLVGMG